MKKTGYWKGFTSALVLVGLVKSADHIAKEMLGL